VYDELFARYRGTRTRLHGVWPSLPACELPLDAGGTGLWI